MYKKTFIVFLTILLSGCFAKKKTTYSKNRTITVASSEEAVKIEKKREPKTDENPIAEEVIESALKFTGVRYRFGGTTKKGMDCSGLVYVALKENDIPFPRISHQMANEGKKVRVSEVQKGDLLFFKTHKRGKNINHVGLIVEVDGDEIKFIHSTTSRGVIVSSLREGYWNSAFVKATRIL
ncbi:C40 family peptidase [uncultured Croceitalea sp.]|uniref:C40 family peptidase n=1 Tax=uncultured Croceitalea sp. TaxID=1798908 RepID=UPI003305BBEB